MRFCLPTCTSTEVIGIVLPILLTVIWICATATGLGMILWVAGWILDGFHNE